jgi:hypothetical protein
VPDERELDTFAVKSYRYLRMSIVVVVLALMASVLIEVAHAGCWQESISAYYYTPVHAMFVGALLALGVSMIAIKGATDLEDVLLNIAGVLAPIVAFVPTSPPTSTDVCPATASIAGNPQAFVDNNLLALAIGGAVAIVVAYVIAALVGKASIRRVDAHTGLGLVISVALLVAGLVWYFGFRDNFLDHAHGGAAGVMFLLIAIVILINARSARHVHGGQPGARRFYWVAYALLFAMMVLAAVGVLIAKLVDSAWRHQILLIEILELTPFAVFWSVQTQEFWLGGVPTGEERDQREAAVAQGAPAQ